MDHRLVHSVLRTCFLPRWQVGEDGRVYDTSGLGGEGGQKTFVKRYRWKNVNTDSMSLEYEEAETRSNVNLPLLHGQPIPFRDYIEDLIDGFRVLHNRLRELKMELLAPEGPLRRFADLGAPLSSGRLKLTAFCSWSRSSQSTSATGPIWASPWTSSAGP